MRKIYLILLLLAAPTLIYAADEANLSALLGGIVQSDSWIIRKNKLEEEFAGNVHFENDIYKIHADRAISRRKEQTYTIEGNVRASRRDKDFSAEITAAKIFYNNISQTGFAAGDKKSRLTLYYEPAGGPVYRVYGDRLDFADKFNAFTLSGNGELHDGRNTLRAGKMSYNRQTGAFEAWGQRPLLTGSNDEAYYALQADKIAANTREGIYRAQGRAQGWIAPVKDIKDLKDFTSLPSLK